MEGALSVGFFGLRCCELTITPSILLMRSFSFHRGHGSPRPVCAAVSRSGKEFIGEDIMHMFVEERRTNGDFISKASDLLWRRDHLKLDDSETSTKLENLQQINEITEDETVGGFLKLTRTREWVAGDYTPPVNKRFSSKDWQNDSEKRKKLNLLKYEALKNELLLLTMGIGAACCVYCFICFSVEAAASYATGVLFSCLYLRLLYYHADNVSQEDVPKIFVQKKIKRIGIRSEDLRNALEKTLSGSTMSLSSPRLVIPATIFGLWALSNNFLADNFEFELVPGMLGFFAYKAAALVQVYRDNEDLRLVFPDQDEELQ